MFGNDKFQLDIYVEHTAAGTDATVYRTFRLPGNWYIEDCQFMPDDSITADDTDYTTVELYNVTDSVSIHSRATDVAGGSLTAGTAVSATLTEGSARVLTQGDKLRVTKADTASGKALGGCYTMQLSRRPLP